MTKEGFDESVEDGALDGPPADGTDATVASGRCGDDVFWALDADGVHHFTANIDVDTELALICRGDHDGTGRVNMRDSLAIKKDIAGTGQIIW